MPTPSDEEALSSGMTPVLSLDIAAPLRTAFASCPPEEDRGEQHVAPSGGGLEHEGAEAPDDTGNQEMAAAGRSHGGSEGQLDTASATPSAVERERKGDDEVESDEHIHDHTTTNGQVPEQTPSPAPSLPSSERERDSDTRLAQSMATATISPDAAEASPSARYLHFPELDRHRVCIPSREGVLSPFSG